MNLSEIFKSIKPKDIRLILIFAILSFFFSLTFALLIKELKKNELLKETLVRRQSELRNILIQKGEVERNLKEFPRDLALEIRRYPIEGMVSLTDVSLAVKYFQDLEKEVHVYFLLNELVLANETNGTVPTLKFKGELVRIEGL